MKFENRIGPNLNKKTLEVERVERDQAGEITLLEVKEFRNDGEGLIQEGTPLNAESINSIIRSMIYDYVKQICVTPIQKIEVVKVSLDIPVNETMSFEIPLEVDLDCTIRWETDDDWLKIRGNRVIVCGRNFEHQSVLKAIISCEDVVREFDFIIKIPAFTDLMCVQNDYNDLILKERVTTTFELPVIGYSGSNISWSMISSQNYYISSSSSVVILERPIDDENIKLIATIDNHAESIDKEFDITILGKNSFSSNVCDFVWVNHKDKLNTKNFNITTTKDFNLYVEVINPNSQYIGIEIKQNNTKLVELNISETNLLCNAENSNPLQLDFKINVYLSEDKTILLDTIDCHTFYMYQSSNPSD